MYKVMHVCIDIVNDNTNFNMSKQQSVRVEIEYNAQKGR